MAEKIKSKFTGVYSTNLKNGDKCFFFNYKDINDNNKLKWVKVGRKSENYNLEIANRQRIEQLSKMRHGEDITAVSQKKQKELLTFQDLADRYFIDKNINKYRQNRYNNHIKNTFAKLNVEYITKIDIQRFFK